MWVQLHCGRHPRWKKNSPAASTTVATLCSKLLLTAGAGTCLPFVVPAESLSRTFGWPGAESLNGAAGLDGGLTSLPWAEALQFTFSQGILVGMMASGVLRAALRPTWPDWRSGITRFFQQRWASGLLVLMIVASVLCPLAYVWSGNRVVEAATQLEAHRSRIEALGDLQSAVAEIDTAFGVYATSGLELHLQWVNDAVEDVELAVIELQRKVTRAPVLEEEVKPLIQQVHQRIVHRRRSIQQRGPGGSSLPRGMPADWRGKPGQGVVGREFSRIEERWKRELILLEREYDHQVAWSDGLIVAGSAVAFLTGTLALFFLGNSKVRRTSMPVGASEITWNPTQNRWSRWVGCLSPSRLQPGPLDPSFRASALDLPEPEESGLTVLGRLGPSGGRGIGSSRTEGSLKDGEGLLRIVTDNARVGLVLVSAERRYLFANAAYQEMMGLTHETLIGRHVVEILGPVYEEQVRPRMDRAFAGERICYEARRLAPGGGGEERFFAVTYEPRWEEGGGVPVVVVVIYDITDRRRVEAENAKLAAIVECSDDAITGETLEGIITSWNPGAERLFGYTGSSVLGRSSVVLIPPERRDEQEAILARLRRMERVDHFETVRQRVDGSRIDVSLTVSPILSDEGQLSGASFIARDITERKRAERERSRQALVVENTGDFVAMWERDGTLNYLNRAARDMVGLEDGETAFRTSLGDFFFPEDRARIVDEFIPQVLREGRGTAEVRFRHFRTAEPLWMLFRVFVLRGERGDAIGFATVSVNITDRKRAEEAVAIQSEVLERVAAAAPLRATLEMLLRLIEKQDFALRAAVCLLDSDGLHLRHGAAPSLPDSYARAVDGIRIAEGAGCCGTAAWRRKPVMIDDIMTNPSGIDYRPLAALLGFRSCWSSPILDSQGRVLGTVVIYRGIPGPPGLHHQRLMSLATHLSAIAILRDREERVLRDNEQRFRLLAETLPQMVWTCDDGGAYDFLSQRWGEFTGVSAELQLGSRWIEQVHPEDRPSLEKAWAAAREGGHDFRLEYRIRRHDGQYRWFDTRAVPVRDGTGRILKWCGSNTDITERRRSEEQLREQVARVGLLNQITRAIGERQDLTSIFQVVIRDLEEHLPLDFCCVCLCEEGNATLSVASIGRRSTEVMRQLSGPESLRIPIEVNGLVPCLKGLIVYEPDVEPLAYPLAVMLKVGGLHSLVVAPLQVERQVFGVLMAARREAGAFGSQDCEFLRQLSEHVALATHQAQIYGALQQAYNDLQQTQETVLQQERLSALGQMASGIAHDINNAISPVTLYTEALLEREAGMSPRARGYLATIQRAIDDVAQTVSRMREFCRKRRPQVDMVPLNLNRIVWQVLELTRVRWNDMPQERGWVIRAQTDLQVDLPEVHGVESEIRDALTNLILNAVDAMPEGGTLGIRTRLLAPASETGDLGVSPQAMVEVSDTGLGMDETTRRRCLEPFFTTKGERGTGLGLAMVFGMVQRHGANIDIESAPGLGTAIRLKFKLAPSPSGSKATPALQERLERRIRVLVVDDDPLLLRSLSDTLEADGHEVVLAEGGRTGIDALDAEMARGSRFDLVITDLGMPVVDGRKVAAAVKAQAPNTPVIMLTGWGQRLGHDGELPPNVDCLLNKPPKLPELRQALSRCSSTSPVETRNPDSRMEENA